MRNDLYRSTMWKRDDSDPLEVLSLPGQRPDEKYGLGFDKYEDEYRVDRVSSFVHTTGPPGVPSVGPGQLYPWYPRPDILSLTLSKRQEEALWSFIPRGEYRLRLEGSNARGSRREERR